LGYLSITLEKEKILNQKQNFDCVSYMVQIVDEEKNIANILSLKNKNWEKMKVKELIKLKTDAKFHYGDLLLIQGNPKEIKTTLNPFCFDYKKFLQDQNINYQQNLIFYEKLGNVPANYFLAKLKLLREKLKIILQKHIYDEQAQGVILAMMLGFKKNLGNEIQNIYSTTGVIHVLSVSGLHVGIIFFVINFILGIFFKKRPRHFAKLFLTLISLWIYAGLTGFSPSVIRATLMCSIMLLCNFFSTKNQIQSSISISALFILLFGPKLIYNLGFQLSYSAVIGIILFQKKIKEMVNVKNKFIKYFWEISSVTLSAQIFTLPLILFYFQKFPTYFIFSNLIIIPMSTIFVVLGLLVIFFSPINFLYKIISYALNFVLVWVNKIMIFIAGLPKSSIQGIKIDLYDVIFLYGIIFCFLLFLEKEKILKLLYMVCLLFMAKSFYNEYLTSRQKILIFYNVKPYWALSYIKGDEGIIFLDKKLESFPEIIKNQIIPSLNHYQVRGLECRFYDEKIKMLEIEKMKFCILSKEFKNFLPALNFEFDYLLDNSFLENIAAKIKAKKIICTHTTCDDHQTTPQIFVLNTSV
jgi:competence protein ComEC